MENMSLLIVETVDIRNKGIISLIIVCSDIFLVYLFSKSAFKMHSISSVWNMDPTIISKPCFLTGLLLAIFNIVYMLFTLISNSDEKVENLIGKLNVHYNGFFSEHS